jgi:hypothetical protein
MWSRRTKGPAFGVLGARERAADDEALAFEDAPGRHDADDRPPGGLLPDALIGTCD